MHFKSHADCQVWGQNSEKLKNLEISNLTYRSGIGTDNTWWSSNLKPHQPYPKLHILNLYNQTRNLDGDDKHNPQANVPALNWHNQNPNITTVEISMVLLQ